MNTKDIKTNPRLAGLVKRWHTWPVIREQTVAEHSWQTQRIYLELFKGMDSCVWEYILYHDCGEIATGDIPYPVKSLNPQLKGIIDKMEQEALSAMKITLPSISLLQHKRFKLAHMLEMWEYAWEEHARGNKFAFPIITRTLEATGRMLMYWLADARENLAGDWKPEFRDQKVADLVTTYMKDKRKLYE
jgi:5'-deoxynucleotidase YfbR-like HD superfamily hydrolase